MKLLDQTEVLIQFSDLQSHKFKRPQKPTQQRSSGVHLSDILKYLYFGSLPPKLEKREVARKMQEAGEELDDPTVINLKMILGMCWESFIVGFMPDMQWQPRELKLDGIAGSPDGLTWADWEDTPVIEEFKFTFKSCRDRLGEKILQESLWCWQIKSYVHMYDTTMNGSGFRPQARLHVCWVNGDYTHPYQPRYTKHLIGFDDGELESFWQRAILPNKDRAMAYKREQEALLKEPTK